MSKRLNVKVSAMKADGDVDARIHIYIATALGRGRVGRAAFTLGKFPLFHRRLCELQDQSRHDGIKKKLHPLRHPGSNPGRRQAPCRLSYLVHILDYKSVNSKKKIVSHIYFVIIDSLYY